MKKRDFISRCQRKFSLMLSVVTFFSVAFLVAQLMFAPSMVHTVYAGSTLTPTSEPPPPTNTPQPPPTNTPQPSNSGGSNNQPPPPTPTPEIPQEIPELGVGAEWQPLFLTITVMLIALGAAAVQGRHLLGEHADD